MRNCSMESGVMYMYIMLVVPRRISPEIARRKGAPEEMPAALQEGGSSETTSIAFRWARWGQNPSRTGKSNSLFEVEFESLGVLQS